jgi:hypothetical protein
VVSPAVAAGQPPTSSSPRAIPKPTNRLSLFPRSPRSYPCHTLTSSAPVLAGVRVPAAAPPLVCRRRSPLAGDISGQFTATHRSRVSPIAIPPRLFATPCLTSPPASSPSPLGVKVKNRGYGCEEFKLSRDQNA